MVYAVLPRLVAEFGEDGFELRLVGGGAPPRDIAQALQKPYVCFAGRVVPADPEFLAADVMMVPTNIPLGIRVRIITAWSFGCPVVAHRANASGIPEMQDGENSLLADTDTQLANGVVSVLSDEALRNGSPWAVEARSNEVFLNRWLDRRSWMSSAVSLNCAASREKYKVPCWP